METNVKLYQSFPIGNDDKLLKCYKINIDIIKEMEIIKKLTQAIYNPFNNQLLKLRQAFVDQYGTEIYERILDYIKENKIYDQCINLKNEEQLFEFSVNYGILEFVKFLYEYKNITYNYNILTRYCINIISQEYNDNKISLTTSSGNIGLTSPLLDKYSSNRLSCIHYLINMKKYSKMTSKDKNFYYTFNPKYLQICRTL